MKRIMFVLIVFCISIESNAAEFAIDKGSVLVSGSLSLSSTQTSYTDYYGRSVNGSSIYSARITPTVGVFVNKGFVIGPALDLSLTKYPSYSQVAAGYGIKSSYYIGDANKSVYPRIGFDFLFTNASSGEETIYKGTIIAPNVGLDFMLSPKMALGVELGYNIHSYKYQGSYASYSYYGYGYGPNTYTDKTIYLAVGLSAFCF